ncbi:MAG: FecR family protein [Asticcacaulis sp.]
MSNEQDNQADVELIAAQWVVRVQGDDLRDEDISALTQWLEASPDHTRAFENALMTWGELDGLRAYEDVAPAHAAPVQAVPAEIVYPDAWRPAAVRVRTAHMPAWRHPAVMSAMAAAVAAAIIVPLVTLRPAPVSVYETQKGQRQTVALADGSTLNLNTNTRVSVQLSGHDRRLVLDHGEVALKVVHDAARPLTLRAGDAQVTDIGTEFNVRHDDGSVAVTVREGEVRLSGGQGAASLTLTRGDVGLHREGAPGVTRRHADPDEVFAWQSAHAIYHDQPLSAVVKDLNRYFDTPITVDAEAGKLRLNAILTLDSELLVVRRLQDFLPVRATTTDGGSDLSLDPAGRGTL